MENNEENSTITGIFLGDRGINFKSLITGLLKKGNIKQKYIDLLTSEESMNIYSAAFTSEQIDENNNYQVYEQLGDLTGNKFIVWYIYKRFPQLKCAEGVKVAARLRINLGSKNSFFSIAEKYGFWDYISATNELRQRKKKPLLEDVFEAFLGATEVMLDEKTRIGVGYACVYKILSKIFDEMHISLKYEDLYDSKTRLKELFDIYAEKLGPLKYEEKRDAAIFYSSIYRLEGAKCETKEDGTIIPNTISGQYKKVLIGQGSAALKADAEQNAATDALKKLTLQGYIKYAPAIYSKFAEGKRDKTETTNNDILKIIEHKSKINEQFSTRGKNKYQNKYTSPVLTFYCRKADCEGVKKCLEMGADPNIADSEGMFPTDILFLSVKEKLLLGTCLEMMSKKGNLTIHKNIYNFYKDNIQEWKKCLTKID